MSENQTVFDYQEIVGKLWRAKWKIIGYQLLVVVLCAAVIFLWPRSYKSEARVFLQLGKESVSLDPTVSSSTSKINVQSSTREDEIITALDVLKSREVASRVVDTLTPKVVLGLEASDSEDDASTIMNRLKGLVGQAVDLFRQIDPLPDRERAIIGLEKNLKVTAERKSEVVVIKYESKTPKLAQLVVSKIVEAYKDEHMKIHRTAGSKSFFMEQQAILEKELDDTNERIRTMKNSMGLASISGQRDLLEVRNKDISLSIAETERALNSVNARIEKIEEDLSSVPERINSTEVVKPNVATDMQAQQLYSLQLQANEFESKYQAEHPKLINIRNQVREAEANYRKKESKSQEITDDLNPIHRKLTLDLLESEAEKAGIEAKMKNLLSQKEQVLENIRDLNQHEIVITDLERERGVREAKYISYTNSLEEARLNLELDASRISSIVTQQDATLEEKPVSPSKLLVCIFGIGLILAGSCCLAFLIVKLDDRLTTPDSVRERTGLPVLCTLPKTKSLA